MRRCTVRVVAPCRRPLAPIRLVATKKPAPAPSPPAGDAAKPDPKREKSLADLVAARDRYAANTREWRPLMMALVNFGVVIEQRAQQRQAEECYKEAHRLATFHDPSETTTALILGRNIQNQGRFADSLPYFDEVITKLEPRASKSKLDLSTLGHAWEGRASSILLKDDVPAAVPLIEKALSYLRDNPPSFVEVAQEWVKFLLRVFEKPHLRAVPRVGDLSFAEKICNEAIDILEKEVAAKSFVEAPQLLLDSVVDLSSIKSSQLDHVAAEMVMDKAYKVWDEQVKPVVADNQREVMEMQMRLLTARRAHANKKNAATEYRKAIEDYTSVVKRSENKDKSLYVPEFDLLATALTGLGHLRLELGWSKHGANNEEAAKHFEALRLLHRKTLMLPDPLTISASFITKQANLAKEDDNYKLKIRFTNRREEPVWTNLKIIGSQSEATHAVAASEKDFTLNLESIKLDEEKVKPDDHFQEVVLEVYADEHKQKLIDVHREFVLTT